MRFADPMILLTVLALPCVAAGQGAEPYYRFSQTFSAPELFGAAPGEDWLLEFFATSEGDIGGVQLRGGHQADLPDDMINGTSPLCWQNPNPPYQVFCLGRGGTLSVPDIMISIRGKEHDGEMHFELGVQRPMVPGIELYDIPGAIAKPGAGVVSE